MNLTFLELLLVFFGFALVGVAMMQVKLLRLHTKAAQQQLVEVDPVPDQLKQQVDELNQSMAGVVQNVSKMGKQVQNLNVLAGYAIKEARSYFHLSNGEADADDDTQPQERILLEIRRIGASGEEEMQSMSPEDMPPEIQEKFKTFKAIYMHAMQNPKAFPQRRHPEWN